MMLATNDEPTRRWKRAGLWFVGSCVATAASFVYVLANTELIMASRHDPLVGGPVGAAALFVVLMAPSTVIVGTLVALRGSPLQWGRPSSIGVAVLLAANLVFAVAGVADGL